MLTHPRTCITPLRGCGKASAARIAIMSTLRTLALLLAITAVCSLAAAVQVTSAPTLFEGAWLFSSDGSAPIAQSAILVDNDRIVAVGRQGAISVPTTATRVDFTGKFVIPALIDAHS